MGVNRAIMLLGCAATVLLIAGCAPHANPFLDRTPEVGDVAGFWLGLWHGMIVVLTFVVSLFDRSVTVYEVHNSGALYNLGFLIGVSGVLFGGSEASGRAS